MMSWAQALEILKTIVANMNNNAEGIEWLNRLEQVDCRDAHRLGYCIAIDVASGAVSVEQPPRAASAEEDEAVGAMDPREERVRQQLY
jgi:hypothetical protein